MPNNTDFFKEKGSLIDRIKIDLFNVIFVKYAHQYDADEQYREMRLRKKQKLIRKLHYGLDALYNDVNPDNMTSSELMTTLINLHYAATKLVKWNDELYRILAEIERMKLKLKQAMNENNNAEQHH